MRAISSLQSFILNVNDKIVSQISLGCSPCRSMDISGQILKSQTNPPELKTNLSKLYNKKWLKLLISETPHKIGPSNRPLGGVWPDPAQHPGGHYQRAPGEGQCCPGLHVGRAVRGEDWEGIQLSADPAEKIWTG